jgi:hypothetical protein
MTKTRISILAAVIASNFLASFALAVDGSSPWNPYSDPPGRINGTGDGAKPIPQAVQRYNRNPKQYPSGPYGRRIVEVSVAARQLNPAECRPLMQLDYKIAAAIADIRSIDNYINEYTRRIWLIARYKSASREHLNAWRNLANTLDMLHKQRYTATASLRNLQASRYHMAAKFSSGRPTRVIINVRNHLKRSYIPTSHFLKDARQHVLANPELIGTTVYLNR